MLLYSPSLSGNILSQSNEYLVNSMVAISPYQSTLVDTPMQLTQNMVLILLTLDRLWHKLSMNLLKGYYTFYICSTLTDSMSHDTQHTTSYVCVPVFRSRMIIS